MTVHIPVHLWEKTGKINVWYTLKWTFKDEIRTLDVSPSVRNVSIDVPLGETAIICAYPFGDKQASGAFVIPSDKRDVYLDQNSGVLASLLLNCDRDVTSCLNYPSLKNMIENAGCLDYRALDGAKLLTDMMNGKLSSKSIVLLSPVTVSFIPCLDGVWIAESIYDSGFTATSSMSPTLNILPGMHRYYSPVLSRIIEIAVDSDGNYYASPPVPFY